MSGKRWRQTVTYETSDVQEAASWHTRGITRNQWGDYGTHSITWGPVEEVTVARPTESDDE